MTFKMVRSFLMQAMRATISGFHERCEFGDDSCIDGIGFGELVGSSGEVTNLSGIDEGDNELVFVEIVDEFAFVPAGGFEADELWILFFQEVSQPFETCFGVKERLDFGVVGDGDVKFLFGDIDSDTNFVML